MGEIKQPKKHCYSTFSDLAHLFPHEDNKEAYCRNGILENNTIYSYNRSFPVARIVKDKKGNRIVFFTTRTYSSTTAGHISDTRRAVSHMNILYMKRIIFYEKNENKYEHEENIKDFVDKIEESLDKFSRAIFKHRSIEEARIQLDRLEKYVAYFKLKSTLTKKIKDLIVSVKSDKWDKKVDIANAKRKTREQYNEEHYEEIKAKKEAKALKEGITRIDKWRNFKVVSPYEKHRSWNMPVLLRHRGDRIETSKGIKLTVTAAHEFYRYIKIILAKGGCTSEEYCKFKVMNTWNVQEITQERVVVGCHTIPISEILLIANKLQWDI